jgi:hypothetical protein
VRTFWGVGSRIILARSPGGAGGMIGNFSIPVAE